MKNKIIIAAIAGSVSLTSLYATEVTSGDMGLMSNSVLLNDPTVEVPQTNDNTELLASINNVVLMGNSPSSRKNSNWLVDHHEEETMPLAPDEVAEATMLAEVHVETIHKIKIVKKEREVEMAEKAVRSKIWYERVSVDADIEIYISGGGFSGGVNPRIHDQIMISNSGLVQRMYETEMDGRIETKTEIDREELFELVKWIAENGFFEFDNEYECPDGDQVCLERKDMRPEPIPLKVVVAIGPYRNVVSVPIFSPEKNQDFIPYPDSLRKIVKAIYDFASL